MLSRLLKPGDSRVCYLLTYLINKFSFSLYCISVHPASYSHSVSPLLSHRDGLLLLKGFTWVSSLAAASRRLNSFHLFLCFLSGLFLHFIYLRSTHFNSQQTRPVLLFLLLLLLLLIYIAIIVIIIYYVLLLILFLLFLLFLLLLLL